MILLYALLSFSLLYMPKSFAGSRMSCLNQPAASKNEQDLSFQGWSGYNALAETLRRSDHKVEQITRYIQNGADPNYIVPDDSDWSGQTIKFREMPRQRTIMNELWWIALEYWHIRVIQPIFIAKACALVRAGASLSVSHYDSESGCYGVELKPIAYRMNVPWQLKRLMFTHCCGTPIINAKVQFLLDLRSGLMKTWDEKVIANKKKISDHFAIVFDSGKKPICDIIAEYARNDLLYQELENQVYYDCDDKGAQGRLLSAPEGNYKPCVHNQDYRYSRPSDPCTGPCKEVFEAFGMQQSDPERYKALKNSRFADRDEFLWI